ncbi:unnamed protein product [Cutaneotrichosporon oleaginosum]
MSSKTNILPSEETPFNQSQNWSPMDRYDIQYTPERAMRPRSGVGNVFLFILAIFLPPVPVFIKAGCGCDILVNILFGCLKPFVHVSPNARIMSGIAALDTLREPDRSPCAQEAARSRAKIFHLTLSIICHPTPPSHPDTQATKHYIDPRGPRAMPVEIQTHETAATGVSKTTDDAKTEPNGVGPTSSSVTTAPCQEDIDTALRQRAEITARLADSPYDLVAYLERARVHATLGYPDLAAGDAYRALLLADEARTEGFEYHEEAAAALAPYDAPSVLDGLQGEMADRGAAAAYRLLTRALLDAGCLSSAATFLKRGLDASPNDTELASLRAALEAAVAKRMPAPPADIFAPDVLPDTTLVRREVYPWNEHEPDRFSAASLAELNATLQRFAPKCAVQVATLPVLLDGVALGTTCSQLGVFATADIAPGEKVLEEYSLLTANNRMKDSVCDACSSELPRDRAGVVLCDECYDTVFCSAACAAHAERYHPAVCGTGADEIGKDPAPHEADESLHLLLLARVLALAAQGDVHPLDVPEVKYIWGDFTPHPTLPWSFKYNVEVPLHILETMDVDVFAAPQYDTWVLNTLYAKFRGTASARKNPLDGKPDVAAVHPYWCLANHDCDPNVSWDWAGTIVLTAREERMAQPAGVKAGEEILNHYCDIRLPVAERREWASGPLGGWCMCARCKREAKEGEWAEEGGEGQGVEAQLEEEAARKRNKAPPPPAVKVAVVEVA